MHCLILWRLCNSPGNTFRRKASQAARGPIVWNKIFRMLDVDIITDSGEGIIHPNELCQGVVINPSAIQLVKTVKNILPYKDKAEAKDKRRAMNFEVSIRTTPNPSWAMKPGEVDVIKTTVIAKNEIEARKSAVAQLHSRGFSPSRVAHISCIQKTGF
jgi:hypothetical protein